MAKYNVVMACGHEEIVNLTGPHRSREARIEWMQANKICSACYHAQLEEKRKEAAEQAEREEWATLKGTEKQVAWALTIRANAVKNVLQGMKPEDMETEYVQEFLDHLKHYIKNARWWIEHRDYSRSDFVQDFKEWKAEGNGVAKMLRED